MSTHETHVTVLREDDFTIRKEQGLYVSMDGLRVIDCGDDRGVTSAVALERSKTYGLDTVPGRLFGAAGGVAVASLATLAAGEGEQGVRKIHRTLGAWEFTDIAVAHASSAKYYEGVDLVLHSDDTHEGHDSHIDTSVAAHESIGCAALLAVGVVVKNSTNRMAFAEAEKIDAVAGMNLPLHDARDALQTLSKVLTPAIKVTRQAFIRAIDADSRHTPTAIHAGSHAPNTVAQMTVDLAGHRCDARQSTALGIHRYMHTPGLAARFATDVYPESTEDLSRAVSLLHAMGVRQALSGTQDPHALAIEIIPAEYQ